MKRHARGGDVTLAHGPDVIDVELDPHDEMVRSDGEGRPPVTDGPFPESKELLAGYRLIDVESLERALEIAAQASAAPGQEGAPIRQPIEVRQVLSAPDPEV